MAGKFSLDLSRIVAKAQGSIDLVVQKVTFDIFRSVILKSPVLSGRFRGNWTASVSSYNVNAVEVMDKNGSSTVKNMSDTVFSTKAGNVVYLVNSLPYAVRLEYGYSKQAPLGMVRTTIASYQSYINGAIR